MKNNQQKEARSPLLKNSRLLIFPNNIIKSKEIAIYARLKDVNEPIFFTELRNNGDVRAVLETEQPMSLDDIDETILKKRSIHY